MLTTNLQRLLHAVIRHKKIGYLFRVLMDFLPMKFQERVDVTIVIDGFEFPSWNESADDALLSITILLKVSL